MNTILLYYIITIPIALFIILFIERIISGKYYSLPPIGYLVIILESIFWPLTLFIGIMILVIELFQFIIDFFCDLI